AALAALGYSPAQIADIAAYVTGRGTLKDSPAIGHDALRAKGFTDHELAQVERALASVFDIRLAFTPWVLGEGFCADALGLAPDSLARPGFDLLAAIGFGAAEIAAANSHVCGAMTLEGAPHLSPAHLPVFETRALSPAALLRMAAAIQPFVSGGVACLVVMPHAATIDECADLHKLAWRR